MYYHVTIMHIEKEMLHMPQIRPITDLRNTNETSEQIVEGHRMDDSIAEAEDEYQAQGVLFDATDTLAGLRRKHLG